MSAPANLLLFDAIRACLVCRQRATSALRGMRVRRSSYAVLRYFPCNGDDGAVSDGRRAFTRLRGLPAHHSWGLVFARQSGARSRQFSKTGATAWWRRRHGRSCLPRRGSRQGKQLRRYANTTSNRVRFCGGRAYPNMILRSPKATQNTEFILGCFRTAFRALTGRNVTPTTVAFSHNRNSDLHEFERFFGCRVEFGANTNLLALTDDALRIPLLKADPKLLHALRPFCDMAAKERNATTGALRSAVEREVEKLLPHGKATARTVAKNLALSVRTQSRRLADEGTTYAEVVDHLRRSLALQYLKEPDMSVSQIAWLLGDEGSTSFNHAFRRWTGQSPSTARNQRLVMATLT